tara:strand:+ start:80 stop:289 length:210 start_codon:yes stop_codon:yes gene_type:complete
MNVDKGIEQPKQQGRPKAVQYAFLENMESGDSVFASTTEEMHRIRRAMAYRGMKHSVRRVEDGYRIWKK